MIEPMKSMCSILNPTGKSRLQRRGCVTEVTPGELARRGTAKYFVVDFALKEGFEKT